MTSFGEIFSARIFSFVSESLVERFIVTIPSNMILPDASFILRDLPAPALKASAEIEISEPTLNLAPTEFISMTTLTDVPEAGQLTQLPDESQVAPAGH